MIDKMHISVAATDPSISQARKDRDKATYFDQECAGKCDENSLRFGPMSDIDLCAEVTQKEKAYPKLDSL
jgi:hypothetical protein